MYSSESDDVNPAEAPTYHVQYAQLLVHTHTYCFSGHLPDQLGLPAAP